VPTYQYACTDCSEQLEVHQSFTDDALTECPSCEGRLRKVFNAVGVVFKGSGFYKTDSRSNGKGAESSDSADTGKDSKDSTDSGGSTSGKDGGSTKDAGSTKDSGSTASSSKDSAKTSAA
jgi:putative FmdB family regulatory protein